MGQQNGNSDSPSPVFWRVEGSLLDLSPARPVAFFTRNAQSFFERSARLSGLGIVTLVRPFLYLTSRIFATRVLHTQLRGISQDRLDYLGEEYFHYVLRPRLKQRGVAALHHWMSGHGPAVLVSSGLDHVIRPLASHLGVEQVLANRLEFRDGRATGRLLDPVVPPRGIWEAITNRGPDGTGSAESLFQKLRLAERTDTVRKAIVPAARRQVPTSRPIVVFNSRKRIPRLSVREALQGKHILLIGVTGFIGKVWLVHLLSDLPQAGKIYLLIRRQGPLSALRRFEKIVGESPVFDAFHEQYGDRLAQFLNERVEVVEGDVSQPGLGMAPDTMARLAPQLDVIVNSSGLTDFNPDLRDALAANVDAAVYLAEFVRQCNHAALLHLSTCYVVGARDGRVPEELVPNYTPAHAAEYDAEREWRALHDLVRKTEALSKSPAVTEELRKRALGKIRDGHVPSGPALENLLRKHRARWLRQQLTDAGIQRAKELGWPNTYTFTKSLAESLLVRFASDLPVAIVRPSIVETSTRQPFRGWNEGVNTSAPLSYLLGTYFRQLPSNERKQLDLIPVDLVCRGMTLIAAALAQRCHQPVYQLATSASNPCDMRRSIELTCLGHRKYYVTQEGLEHWLRSRFDTIPVSKERYQKFSAPGLKALIRAIQKSTPPLPFLKPPLVRTERNLDRVEKLIELYEPFILHNDHVFEAEHVELLSWALPPEEQDAFGYDPGAIDWWDYWINIHIPAQRKWSYPLIEGRPLEPRPERPFSLQARPSEPSLLASAAKQGI